MFRAYGDTRNQPIAAFRDRLNEAWLFDIVTEDAAQFRDAARQHVVADEHVGPDRSHQSVLGHDLTGLRRKAHEHLHDFWFQASGAGGARHSVERRLHMMEFADAKAVLQGFAQ